MSWKKWDNNAEYLETGSTSQVFKFKEHIEVFQNKLKKLL